MVRVRPNLVTAAVLAIVIGPRPAAAQGRAVEVSAGYAWLDDSTDEVTFPAGWNAGVAFGIMNWLSLAASVSGHTKTFAIADTDATLHEETAAGGLRAAAKIGPLLEFGQVLFGIEHGGGTVFGSTDSITHFMWEPGAGLDIPIGGRFAARAEIDEQMLPHLHQLRFLTGIVYRLRK